MNVTKAKTIRVEINSSYVCNAACDHCNRAIGVIRVPNSIMTAEQVHRMGKELRSKGVTVERVAITGGEPTKHPDLAGLVEAADTFPGMHPKQHTKNVIFTNCVDRDGLRKTLELPPNWKWVDSPLNDTADPVSGKDKHFPFFISPLDDGLESKYENCRIPAQCGHTLDAFGFSMCAVAGSLGRMLRINPYSHEYIEGEHPKDICKHCQLGLTKRQLVQFFRRNKRKSRNYSETFMHGINQYRADPMEIDRY